MELVTGIQIEGYRDSKQHIFDELKCLDLLIYKKLTAEKHSNNDASEEMFKGFVMSEEEALATLNNRFEAKREDEQFVSEYEQFVQYIYLMREKSAEKDCFLSFNYVQQAFQLSRFEEKCLMIVLAPELDRKYEQLYGYLQDDMNYKYATVDLVLNLLCDDDIEKWEARRYFLKEEKLFKFFFEATIEREEERTPLLKKRLKIRERIVHFLLDVELVHEPFSKFSNLYYPYEPLPPLLLESSLQERLVNVVKNEQNEGEQRENQLLFFLTGESGVGKSLQVKHFCQTFNRSLLMIELAKLLNQEHSFVKNLHLLYTEAVLQQAVICFRDVDLLDEERYAQSVKEPFIDKLTEFSGVVFLLSKKRPSLLHSSLQKRKRIIEIELKTPNAKERLLCWRQFSSPYSFKDDVDYSLLANMFEFTAGKIKDSLAVAAERAKWEDERGDISQSLLVDACYRQIDHQLETKARRLKPNYTWPDLVLPDEVKKLLAEACNHVKYRGTVMDKWGFGKKLSYGKGISMLFAGPPGTGKTMAAEVIANELRLEIYKVDLSQTVSKYIGETEKNLKVIFEQAQLANAILFFDETDALFGKRSAVNDAKDKYANIEVAYLLQKMEEHQGIIILATNFLENIDEAFLRRISFVISFPFPEMEQREAIWRQMFPKEAPLSSDVDFSFLAEKLPLAGGNIKNIVLGASFLAADKNEVISMKHLIDAATHEMKKSGKIILASEFSEYSES